MNTWKAWAAAAGLVALTGAAQASPVFLGRLADGTASSTCTVSGPTKCAMFYNTTLDITILNDWNIGKGFWSETADIGSAQALAASAGFAVTGLSGWVLPTGDFRQPAGALDQYRSIWASVGSTMEGLQDQFDGVQSYANYWSSSKIDGSNPAMFFTFNPGPVFTGPGFEFYAVAVRPGDVTATAPVPEPQTLALALLALGATAATRRRRSA